MIDSDRFWFILIDSSKSILGKTQEMLVVNTRNSSKSVELLSEVVNKRSNNADCRILWLHFIFSQFGPGC